MVLSACEEVSHAKKLLALCKSGGGICEASYIILKTYAWNIACKQGGYTRWNFVRLLARPGGLLMMLLFWLWRSKRGGGGGGSSGTARISLVSAKSRGSAMFGLFCVYSSQRAQKMSTWYSTMAQGNSTVYFSAACRLSRT